MDPRRMCDTRLDSPQAHEYFASLQGLRVPCGSQVEKVARTNDVEGN